MGDSATRRTEDRAGIPGPAREGRLADSSQPLILDALRRAIADPGGAPLHGSRTDAGLFPGSAAAKKAARACKDREFLHVLRTEQRDKGPVEVCAITERGLAFLINQTSARAVLDHLIAALTACEKDIAATRSRLDQLRAAIERVLTVAGAPAGNGAPKPNGVHHAEPPWAAAMLDALAQWQTARPTEDCPLPELYRHANQAATVSVGAFHDGLRCLHQQGRLYLHPWTGSLHDLPEPTLALLIGHSIAYYASRK